MGVQKWIRMTSKFKSGCRLHSVIKRSPCKECLHSLSPFLCHMVFTGAEVITCILTCYFYCVFTDVFKSHHSPHHMSGPPFMSESDSGTSSTTPPSSPLRSKSKKGRVRCFMLFCHTLKTAGGICSRRLCGHNTSECDDVTAGIHNSHFIDLPDYRYLYIYIFSSLDR